MKSQVTLDMLLGVLIGAWPVTAAVTNITQGGTVYPTIKLAVNAAVSGDTLLISTGRYDERVTISQKSLTLKGGYLADFVTRTNLPELTCINAGAGGTAMSVASNGTVTIEYLLITNGAALAGGGIAINAGAVLTAQSCVVAQNVAWAGGGIYVGRDSALELSDTILRYNSVLFFGGGLYVASNAVATLRDNVTIRDNYGALGGGAYVAGSLLGDRWSVSIRQNTALDGGGVAVDGGVLELNPGHVSDNQATNAASRGGGIYVFNGGRASVLASGNMAGNRAYNGGGIYGDAAQIQLLAVVHGNIASNFGGGVCLTNSSLTAGLFIGMPTPLGGNTASAGGGIYAMDSEIDFRGAMYNNYAALRGAGIGAIGSTVTLFNARVGGTGTNQANRLGPNGNSGAGLYLARSIAVISNSVIASNVFQTASFTYGGGLYVTEGSIVSLTDSRIEQHLAPSSTDGRGAGLYVNNSSVTLNNSHIISNAAGTTGGGVRLYGTGSLSALHGSVIADNRALNGSGGGIACGGAFAIIISNATLRGNSAALDGGALYLAQGTQSFVGAWALVDNTAGGNGGAVAVAGPAKIALRAFDACIASSNRAVAGHGGMLYLDNNSTVQLYANAGYPIQIQGNTAGGNGGALYANTGGYFDVYGMITMEGNRAQNGGAIYLNNGSRVWLDDYVNILPKLWDNRAETGNGGAICALNSPSVRLTGVTLGRAGAGNYALGNGGAIAAYSSTVRIERTGLFLENTARSGGAIAASNALVSLEAGLFLAPIFISNTSFGASVNDGGGAIYAEHGARLIGRNPVFCDNTSTNHGGAVWLRNASAELYADFAQWPGGGMPPLLFSNNVAISGNGGALYLSHGSSTTLADALAVNNRALIGGGVRVSASTAELVNVVLCQNSAGIRVASGRVRARHCTIVSNSASGVTDAGFVSLSNCIVRGHTVNVEAGKDVHFSNVEGGYATGTGNIDADPLFVNAAVHNFALKHTSPCVDAGADVGVTNDCIGAKRPMNSGYDMGAYEMDPTPIQVVTPTLLDFGDVPVGDTAYHLVNVASTGNGIVTGTVDIVLVPIFSATPESYVIPSFSATNVTIAFKPLAEFAWTANVVFASNGGTQNVVAIGTGIPEPAMLALLLAILPALRRRASWCA